MNTQANETLMALLAINTDSHVDAAAVSRAARQTRAGQDIDGFIEEHKGGLILFSERLRRILENTVKSPVQPAKESSTE